MKKIYCVKCGIRKDLKKYDTACFKISEDSNPNVMKFENCYVCKKCEKLERFCTRNPTSFMGGSVKMQSSLTKKLQF